MLSYLALCISHICISINHRVILMESFLVLKNMVIIFHKNIYGNFQIYLQLIIFKHLNLDFRYDENQW